MKRWLDWPDVEHRLTADLSGAPPQLRHGLQRVLEGYHQVIAGNVEYHREAASRYVEP